MSKTLVSMATVGLCALASCASAASPTVEGFDGGSDGGFTGNAFFEAAGGNPGGNARHLAPDLFFNSLRTGGVGEPANPNFLGDYSSLGSVTLSFDVKVDELENFNGPIAREVGISFRDRDVQGPSGDSGVFYTIGVLSEALSDWTTMSGDD